MKYLIVLLEIIGLAFVVFTALFTIINFSLFLLSAERNERIDFNHRMKMSDCKIIEMINEDPKCYLCKDDIKVCYE